MRMKPLCLLFSVLLPLALAHAQGTVPTFIHAVGQNSYTLLGRDPAQSGTTTIPTLLVPITLSFEATPRAGKPFVMDAAPDVLHVLQSPLFSEFAFPSGGATQFADAMLRTTFPKATDVWHTLLRKSEAKPVTIAVPAGYGYILTSKKTGESLAVADVEFVQKELFKQIPKQQGTLVIAITHNTTYYALGDATVCCGWGTHGIDSATGNSFVLGSYLHAAPGVVDDADVQPLTQQLGEFVNDPLHDPLTPPPTRGSNVQPPGNSVPAWMRPSSVAAGSRGSCGGRGIGSTYFLLEPTDTNPKNNIPVSKAFVANANGAIYHLQNIALLPWYTGVSADLGATYSFPDTGALPQSAQPCPAHDGTMTLTESAVPAVQMSHTPNGHQLIGYWVGYGAAGSIFPLREVSPQWDIILVAFSSPDKNAPEGTMQFHTPAGYTTEQFKGDIAYLKSRGKKVMISLGGGGEYFSLADPQHIPNFVSSITRIVADYGFDGIDLDFESPSLAIQPGDTDFKHPTTPSIVNLIAGLRQLRQHFGPRFLISLVPEGTQIPAGHLTYGGQFGSYLAMTYALRDILAFVDVQDYNTPPLEGLDGEIYQAGSVDYHAAMTELLLHGFAVAGDPKQFFPPLPPDQVAVGFLTGETTPAIVRQAMDYLITGNAPSAIRYKLRNRHGYPGMIGAMFWTIDADRRENYKFSNTVGPQLHSYPATQSR